MIRRIFLLLIFFTTLLTARSAAAQSETVVSELVTAYTFGGQIIIRGQVLPEYVDDPISIQLVFAGDDRTLTVDLETDAAGSFVFIQLISDRYIQAFSEVAFKFIVETLDGSLVETESYSFFYSDNRFDWRTLEAAPFRVHWYQGDVAFGQQSLDAARNSLERIRMYFEVGTLDWMDIYIYASRGDYEIARDQLNQRWAGGHVEPDTGLAILSILPTSEALLEIERKIPHEVVHLVLYQLTGVGFWNLPAWLNEGLASVLETLPNPDYEYLVTNASENGTLIPIMELCEVFPPDASDALLAYAESSALVRYIDTAYGPAGIRALVESYAAGASCDQGPLVAPIRLDLQALDGAWQGVYVPADAPASEFSPEVSEKTISWLLILLVVLAGPVLVLVGSSLKRG